MKIECDTITFQEYKKDDQNKLKIARINERNKNN